MKITYKKGDIFQDINTLQGHHTLIHICNNKGGWGKGFVTALSKFNTLPERVYRTSFKENVLSELGYNQNVEISPTLDVINMIAQNGYKTADNPVPLNYVALDTCFKILASNIKFRKNQTTIIAPKIGTGLAGGSWASIEDLLKINFIDNGIPVIIYELD